MIIRNLYKVVRLYPIHSPPYPYTLSFIPFPNRTPYQLQTHLQRSAPETHPLGRCMCRCELLPSPKNCGIPDRAREANGAHLRRNCLIVTGVVGCAVGEQVVDDHSDNGEEEDNERPEDLLARAAVGLDDFD